MTRGIIYKTGVECIGKRSGYYIFHDRILGTYGVVKDEGQQYIYPPYCGYCSLESLLELKGISNA